ncbi:MAG TPA: glycosyltransferase family 39 protein [Pirellulales bacterium]|jgi:hypothetical protein
MMLRSSIFAVTRFAGWLQGPLPVALLIAAHLALGISAVNRKSITYDEGIHVTGGLSYWKTNDYRLQPENGNWSQRFVALPAWLGGFVAPPFTGDAWQNSDVRILENELFYGVGNDADTLLRDSRLIMAIPSAMLALTVYLWSRKLFGPTGGLVSLALYAFSPSMLANGFLTTSDLFATLFFLTAMAAEWRLLNRPSPGALIIAALTMSGLLLCKFSGALLIPMVLILVAIRVFFDPHDDDAILSRNRLRQSTRHLALSILLLALQVPVVVGVIWASYGFRYSAFAPGAEAIRFETPWPDIEAGSPAWLRAPLTVARTRHLLPEAYLYGFATTVRMSQTRKAFFLGEFTDTGRIYYFPTSVAVKTPLEVFVLLIIAAFVAVRKVIEGSEKQADRNWPLDAAPLFVLIVVYLAVAMRSGLNIGHRHILPIYPPLLILAGASGLAFDARAASLMRLSVIKGIRAIVLLLIATSAFTACLIWPNYLAYFNLITGGPAHGYRWFVDSSLDWGQDLKGLKSWLNEQSRDTSPPRTYLSYFGVAHPAYYDIRAELLPCRGIVRPAQLPTPLTGGTYCISATMLQAVYLLPCGRWNVDYEKLYQNSLQFLPMIDTSRDFATFPTDVREACNVSEQLRFARLCSFLRAREPDDNIGHSILIYRLTDDDVRKALDGPPCELLPRPE